MKQSNNQLSTTLGTFFKKALFIGQMMIISLSLPSLYYAGISYNNNEPAAKKHMTMTNKGKRILAIGHRTQSVRTVSYPQS